MCRFGFHVRMRVVMGTLGSVTVLSQSPAGGNDKAGHLNHMRDLQHFLQIEFRT